MKLIVFDVDGTLIDSQNMICASMVQAFDAAGQSAPEREAILSIVGLSLPVAVARLAPALGAVEQDSIVAGYRAAFIAARTAGHSPLYQGALECLDALARRDDWLLSIATGKARRGLDAMIAAHGLQGRFICTQTADEHPSKPHPSMLQRILSQTGVEARDAVMIGDTSFDIEMAQAAGMAGFGVGWGYHPPQILTDAGASLVAGDFPALTRAIEEWAQ